MDETYIQVKGQWVYLYLAVDKFGDTVDFMLSEKRDEAAATAFFKQAIDNNYFPKKVIMDKSGANYTELENINFLLILAGIISFVEILQIKYLNNRVEQDHLFIKKITKPMMDFKAFHPLFSIALNEQFVNWSCRSKIRNDRQELAAWFRSPRSAL